MTTVMEMAAALDALGQAYRLDWSNFDGRQLKHQLARVSRILRDDEPVDSRVLCIEWGINPETHEWEH